LEKRVETHLRTLQLAQGALPTKQLKMVKGALMGIRRPVLRVPPLRVAPHGFEGVLECGQFWRVCRSKSVFSDSFGRTTYFLF